MHAVQRSMRKPSGVERTDSDRLSPWQASAQASDGVLLVLIVGGNCDIVRRDTSVVGGRARTAHAGLGHVPKWPTISGNYSHVVDT